MSNTTVSSGRFVTITGLDANWDYKTDLPAFAKSGLFVRSIAMRPSATSDRLIVRNGSSATAAKVYDFTAKGADDADVQSYSGKHGALMYPYITISECVFGTAANASVTFELA